MKKRKLSLVVLAILSAIVLHAASPTGIEARQQQILEVYFDTFGDHWAPAVAPRPPEQSEASMEEAIRSFFPALTQPLPTTPDGWRRLAATDKRLMLGAYYAVIGPDHAPDSALLRPLADIVVGPGGNVSTLAEALAKAADGQVIALLPGTYEGHVVLNRDLILIGLGRSGEVIIQGTVKDPVNITGGHVLLCGMTFRFQSQQGAKMYALDINGGVVTAVACRAENDAQAGFVSSEQASSRFLRCIAENNKFSGFISFGRSRLEASHCRSISSGSSGYQSQDDSRMALAHCIAENNKSAGFVSSGRSRLEASHCRAIINGLGGYQPQGVSRMALTHCIAENNKQAGFASHHRSRLDASHCRSLFNGTNSIWEDGTAIVAVSFFESRGNLKNYTVKNQKQDRLESSPTVLIREH